MELLGCKKKSMSNSSVGWCFSKAEGITNRRMRCVEWTFLRPIFPCDIYLALPKIAAARSTSAPVTGESVIVFESRVWISCLSSM